MYQFEWQDKFDPFVEAEDCIPYDDRYHNAANCLPGLGQLRVRSIRGKAGIHSHLIRRYKID